MTKPRPYLLSALLLIILVLGTVHAKEKPDSKKKKSTEDIILGITGGSILFRDQATSPLFYSGLAAQMDIGNRITNKKYNYLLLFSFTAGIASNNFNNEFASSNVFAPQVYTHYVRTITKNKSKVVWQMGAAIDNKLLIRNNNALLNNSFGFDNIGTLFFSNRWEMDVSRKKPFKFEYGFVKINLPERKRHLFFRFNVGVLNTAYRNSYSYIIDGPDFPDYNSLAGHILSLSGFRLQSHLGFEQFLKNGNSFSLNYSWDLITNAGEFEPLDFSQHQVGIALHFNTR